MVDMIKIKSSILKSSASLATVTAKSHFLQVCMDNRVMPKGFMLKFSLQTGLPEESADKFCGIVKNILSDASFNLLNATLQAEGCKSEMLYKNVIDIFDSLDMAEKSPFINLAVAKFKKILLLRTKIHGKKLRKILGYPQSIIPDLDDVVSIFETKISSTVVTDHIDSAQPNYDWFDYDEFPPLDVSVRRDWTLDIQENSSQLAEGTSLLVEEGSVRLRDLDKSNLGGENLDSSSVADAWITSTPCPPSTSTSVQVDPHIIQNMSDVLLEDQNFPVRSQSGSDMPVSQSPIQIVDYSSSNFKPLILHDIEVSDSVISLLKKGPTFSPTPLDPPDLAIIQDDLWDWKERVRWAYAFRKKKLMEDPDANLDAEPFVKPPWYSRTERSAPKASEEIELFLSSVEASLLSSNNFVHFPSNISTAESKAFTELRLLKNEGVSVFLQDKSSRFVVAKRDIIEAKVDEDMSDSTRYAKIEEDDTNDILKQIEEWYKKQKKNLSEVEVDILDWLVNKDAKPGKLKVLIKTHKAGLPVREVFSVCSQPVENLSSFVQFCYLGPIVNSGVLKWRLKDTTDLIKFIHSVNDYLRENRVSSKISICSIDIKNMFPSIFKNLALPAIKVRLVEKGYGRAEVKAVLEALEIIRDGTRVKWGLDTIKQIDGCSLGPADSCDYSDIALDAFLQVLVPKVEEALGVDLLKFLRFFRDDGLFIFLGNGKIVLDMLEILNSEREELSFTTEYCPCGDVLGCCISCERAIPFLDCKISVYSVETDEGFSISQLKTVTYSKPTDVHHYIEPTSCTPNLHRKSLSIIKGVAHRLRVTNMLDDDLLSALNVFSGYLVASGYDKSTILKHFTDVLNISNRSLVFREKYVDPSFKIAFVTGMHPGLPNVQKLFDRFYPVISSCPFSSKVLPRDALISTSRKLPNLSSILAGNPFKVSQPSSLLKGFQKVQNCKCKICKEGFFTSKVFPQVSKDRGYALPAPIDCRSSNVVYLIICSCGQYYVGRTEHPRPRWANHKSHVRTSYTKSCNLASHCVAKHKHLLGEDKLYELGDVKTAFKFILLEALGPSGSIDELKKKEAIWRTRLESWAPIGLNTRDD